MTPSPKQEVKERPIIFSGEMVRAILDGRKTMTRRIVKGRSGSWNVMECPYGQPGDFLWVRETFGTKIHHVTTTDTLVFKADHDEFHPANVLRWRSPIHMPRWASRLTLEITGIRVERLQDISEGDAKAEGVFSWWEGLSQETKEKIYEGALGPVVFKLLWNSIHGEGSWDLNPWVWVIQFRKA